jgi:SNF2 family DNA or RNA helicase
MASPFLRDKSELRESQVYLARKIISRRNVILAAEMATGKTAATLTAVRRLLNEFVVRRVLIVAPKLVAEQVWPEEIASWKHLKALRYSVVTGTPKQRMAALARKSEIDIINRENLAWLWRTLGPKKWPYDMIVYDESSRLKAGKKRTKGGEKTGPRLSEFGTLAHARHKANYVVLLTGTPSPKGLIDLWGQAYICDLGKRLGATRQQFLDRWFDSDYMGWKYTPKKFAKRQIMELLSDIMIGMRTADYVDLPPIVYNVRKVRLSAKIMKAYRQFERELVSEAYDLEAVSRGVLANKLIQFANGSVYRLDEDYDPPKKRVVKIHDAKLDALESIIEEANGRPILLAYGYKHDRNAIKKRFPFAVDVKDDPNWKKKWDSGEIRLLIAHPASIGHGLNLQYGGNIAVWYGLTWDLELYQQFNKRLHRPGQKAKTVFIHHIIAEGTADEDAMQAMQAKAATQDDITEVIRVRLLTRATN